MLRTSTLDKFHVMSCFVKCDENYTKDDWDEDCWDIESALVAFDIIKGKGVDVQRLLTLFPVDDEKNGLRGMNIYNDGIDICESRRLDEKEYVALKRALLYSGKTKGMVKKMKTIKLNDLKGKNEKQLRIWLRNAHLPKDYVIELLAYAGVEVPEPITWKELIAKCHDEICEVVFEELQGA